VWFGHRITGSQALAILLMTAGLAALPIGFSSASDHLGADRLTGAVVVGTGAGLALGRVRASWARAVAAGVFYGLADAAIKAISLGWHAHGAAALESGWTFVAIMGTIGGFLAFQVALQGDGAVSAISLMNALAALVALGCGLLAFGESLGRGAGTALAHLLAIAVVLGGVPVLAAAQVTIVESADDGDERPATRVSPLAATSRPR
jgi:hypothetical protein